MKIHITSTPEYSKENIDAVASVLSQVPGELQFVAGEPLKINTLALENEKFENPDGIEYLTFEELFNFCKPYRILKSIPKDEFVVVLTTIRNDRNWFSAFSNRNIFVDATGWEYITAKDSKYGIAYQIVENVFQSLMGLNINDVPNEPNIHLESIGCTNDMCNNKMEVVLKLRLGYICNSCLSRAFNNGVNQEIMFQIQSILYKLRIGLMDINLIKTELEPKIVHIKEKGIVKVGEKKLEIEALPDSLFIFFLYNLDGIESGTLHEQENKLLEIYRKIRTGGDKEVIRKLCLNYDRPGSSFMKVKWDLNSALVEQLGRKESEFYVIKNYKINNKGIYKINLSPDYLKIDPRF
jgi:hypothetical protein